MPRLFVLDGNQRSALAVTRALGRDESFVIFTGDETKESLAGSSRYASCHYAYPPPGESPTAFLQWLKHFLEAQQIDWVFPCTEVTSQLILHEPEILGKARLPFASLSSVMSLADKWKLVQLAQKVSVPHPTSEFFTDSSELLSRAASIEDYPVVLKPCLSHRRTGDKWLHTSVHIAESQEQLRTLLTEKAYFRDHPFILQQYIEGHGAGLFALYDNGRPITFFAHRRIREKPPQGGVSVVSESVELPPALVRHAKALLDAVQWHGVAMVEFRVGKDGTPYLMEVNTRFWGSLQLAIDSGVDFPTLLFRICNAEVVQPITRYRIGQRLRWLLGDIDSLYLVLRGHNFSYRQKIKRVLAFLTPHILTTRHEVNRLDDLGPAKYELKSYLRALRG